MKGRFGLLVTLMSVSLSSCANTKLFENAKERAFGMEYGTEEAFHSGVYLDESVTAINGPLFEKTTGLMPVARFFRDVSAFQSVDFVRPESDLFFDVSYVARYGASFFSKYCLLCLQVTGRWAMAWLDEVSFQNGGFNITYYYCGDSSKLNPTDFMCFYPTELEGGIGWDGYNTTITGIEYVK